MMGWKVKSKTEKSGVWVFPECRGVMWRGGISDASGLGGLGSEGIVSIWVAKRCWPLLIGLWRAIAPLMMPWCAEGEVPTAANLNLY